MIQFQVTFTTNRMKDGVTCQIKIAASNKLDAACRFASEMESYKSIYPNFLYHLVSVEPMRQEEAFLPEGWFGRTGR